MRRTFDKKELVYIMEETQTRSAPFVSRNNFPYNSSNIILTDDQTGLGITHEVGHPGIGIQGSIQNRPWPHPPSKTGDTPLATFILSQKDMALAVGRSSTSMSDTAVNHELPSGPTLWRRGGSLSRRRNISVPELTAKFAESFTKAPTQGNFIDSRK
jgi:hypothetical protein